MAFKRQCPAIEDGSSFITATARRVRCAPNQKSRRRRDDAGAASDWSMSGQGKARHCRQYGPARVSARPAGSARKASILSLRPTRVRAGYAASSSARACSQRRSCRDRCCTVACPLAALRLPCDSLVVISAQRSLRDGCASGEVLRLPRQARVFGSQLLARFPLGRYNVSRLNAQEAAEALADHEPPTLTARVGQRVVVAVAVRTICCVCELPHREAAAQKITALANESERRR